MSEREVILNVILHTIEGHDAELETLLRELLRSTRLEPGCVAYEVHRSSDESNVFMLYERFKDQGSLDAHLQSDHFQRFLKPRATAADPVASSAVTRWRAIEA